VKKTSRASSESDTSHRPGKPGSSAAQTPAQSKEEVEQPIVNLDHPLKNLKAAERDQKIDDLIKLDPRLKEHETILKRGAIHAALRVTRLIFREDVSPADGGKKKDNLSPEQQKWLEHEKPMSKEKRGKETAEEKKKRRANKQHYNGAFQQSKYLIGSLLATCLAGMIQKVNLVPSVNTR